MSNNNNNIPLYKFISSVFCKAKNSSKGEDAFHSSSSLLIVADGVGGWSLHGVDPSKYSNGLVRNYISLFNKESNDKSEMSLFRKACKMNEHIKGSSTFCLCRLEWNKMRSLNIGDSGYLLIRNGKMVYKSKQQQHGFNFPYQVGTNGDDPSKADVMLHNDIQHNDKVVIATDGLWDNIYENNVVDMVANGLNANAIGNICYKLSNHTRYLSPFCVNSGYRYIGGKPDDITIIVSTIIKQNKL